MYVGPQPWINVHNLVIADPAKIRMEFESRVQWTTDKSPGNCLYILQDQIAGDQYTSMIGKFWRLYIQGKILSLLSPMACAPHSEGVQYCQASLRMAAPQ